MKVLGLDIRVKRIPKRFNSQMKEPWKEIRDGVQKFAQSTATAAKRLMQRPNLLGKSSYEVRPTDDGWMITRRGSTIPIRVYSKKPDAVREARKMGKTQKAEVSIFNRQGALQHHHSFST